MILAHYSMRFKVDESLSAELAVDLRIAGHGTDTAVDEDLKGKQDIWWSKQRETCAHGNARVGATSCAVTFTAGRRIRRATRDGYSVMNRPLSPRGR